MTIPLDTVVRGPEGSVHLLAGATVSSDKIGNQCSVHAISLNQKSVHPNSDLIVKSGGSSVTLFDVEREGGGRTDGSGMLTLGQTVEIELRLGGDGVFSGGFIVGLCESEISCDNPALTIGVAPEDQEVAAGGDAIFEVTLTNSGDEPFLNVDVDASVDACDTNIDTLPVGAQSSYSCTAEGVDADFDLDLHGVARGQDPSCDASADAEAAVRVQQVCNSNPALTITVAPGKQDVPDGGDADFVVTVSNSGDEDLENVEVDSSVAACDTSIGDLATGAEASYGCIAEGVDGDLNVSFVASGEGVIQGAPCSATDSAAATVGNPTLPPTTVPPTTVPPTTAPPTTAQPRIPTGVPTGVGVADSPAPPIVALALVTVGVAAVAAGSYQVARKRR